MEKFKFAGGNIRLEYKENKLNRMSANVHQFKPSPEKEWKPCNCSDSIQRTMNNMNVEGGCENSAILHHGSYIRFGCLQFAFTVIDYSSENTTNLCNDTQENCRKGAPETCIEDDANNKHREENVSGNGESDKEENTQPSTASECEEGNQTSDTMEIDP